MPFLSPHHVKFPAQDAGATLHPETCRESPATRSPAGHNAHPCCWGCNVYHHLPCVSAGWDRRQCWLTGKEFLKILPIVPGNVCQLLITLSLIIMILIDSHQSLYILENFTLSAFSLLWNYQKLVDVKFWEHMQTFSGPQTGSRFVVSSGRESRFVYAGSCYFWPLWSIKIWFKKTKKWCTNTNHYKVINNLTKCLDTGWLAALLHVLHTVLSIL